MAEILKDTFHLQLNVNADGTDRLGAFNAGTVLTITNATNVTPIVVTFASGLLAGHANKIVFITGVGGNLAANGWHKLTNIVGQTAELQFASGSGAYTS